MSDIDVVVAIVTYRTTDLSIECLRSIEAERSTPGICIRVVVVDNAAEDAPLIARAVEENGWSQWVTVLAAPRNGGFAYGNNLAFQRAYYDCPPDYVHMLNPDTLVRKGAIRALVRFLEAHPEVGIAGSSFENFDGSDWPFAFRFPSILSELEQGLQLRIGTRMLRPWVVAMRMGQTSQQVDWVSGASLMIRRKLLDTIGGLDQGYFLYFEETDLCHRAKKAGYLTWYVPESRIMHLAGQSTKVTERNVRPRRLPTYWFESRRRYFATNHGHSYAVGADIVAMLAHAIGSLKRLVQRRADDGIPYFLCDLVQHSALWPKNRDVEATKHFFRSHG